MDNFARLSISSSDDSSVKMLGKTEGLNEFSPWRSFRTALVQKIFQKLENSRILQIRGPPFSGKTSIGQLIATHCLTTGWRVCVLNASPKPRGQNFETFFEKMCNIPWSEFIFCRNEKSLLIVDEATVLYDPESGASSLWGIMKSLAAGQCHEHQLYVVILSSFGGEASVKAGTPLKFAPDQIISLQKGLLLSQEEQQEMFDAFSQNVFALAEISRKYVVRLTNGHAGLTNFLLYLLGTNIVNADRNEDRVDVAVVSYLRSLNRANEMDLYVRGFYKLSSLTRPQQEIAEKVYREKSVLTSTFHSKELDDLSNLVQKGYLYEDLDGFIRFPTALHERAFFIERYSSPLPTSSLQEMKLVDFAKAIVERMDPTQFLNTLSKSVDDKPLESQWQKEFYRCATSILPRGFFISPDVRGESNGLLDFYVNSTLRWGIELLREGTNMKEHESRFSKGGIYYKMIEQDFIRQWIIIDFRSETKRVRQPFHQNMIHICYSSNFEDAILIDQCGREQTVRFLKHADCKEDEKGPTQLLTSSISSQRFLPELVQVERSLEIEDELQNAKRVLKDLALERIKCISDPSPDAEEKYQKYGVRIKNMQQKIAEMESLLVPALAT